MITQEASQKNMRLLAFIVTAVATNQRLRWFN